MTAQARIDYQTLSDTELADRIAARDGAAVRIVTERNNQGLFRAAWSILGQRAEADDAVQSAYLNAFASIASFRGGASLSTWLTRIVINEALGRRRAMLRRRSQLDAGSVVIMEEYRTKLTRGSATPVSPEGAAAQEQIRQILEQAVARLPAHYRLVFVLLDVEGPALKASGIVWTAPNLDRWLSGPTKMAPGVAMGVRVASPQDRADIIAYLRQVPARHP